jgi:hypothetical protein
MTATLDDVYVTALRVDEMFTDPTYQRVLDVRRARKMCAAWDKRLAGILEVSDRGESASPRYAVIDGEHRWAAAGFLKDPPMLVANVHTGLTVADEAKLFDQLNRARKQVGTWDHWKARRASGDPSVVAIEEVLAKRNLRVDPAPSDGCVGCPGALEKVVKLGGIELLDQSLQLITDVWGNRRDALDAAIIHGLALVLHYVDDQVVYTRLLDTLIDVLPRQIKTQAVSMRSMSPGTLPRITAMVVCATYNKKPGKRIVATIETFGGAKATS